MSVLLYMDHHVPSAVYTQDADYLALAAQCQDDGTEHSGIIYAHQLSITIGQAVADLELIAKVMEPDELRMIAALAGLNSSVHDSKSAAA